MGKIFTFILLGTILTLSSCSIQNNGLKSNNNNQRGPLNPEPGKCYGKATFPDTYDETRIIYPIYTGETPEKSEFIQKMDIVTQYKTKQWTRKKDDNCISADSDDCMIWCLVEVPEVKESYYIVNDTSKTKDYKLKTIVQKTNIKKRGYQDWVEVVCQSDATSKLYKDIAFKLISLNYISPDDDITMGSKDIHKALNKYAQDNGLPYGNLNLEVLKKLGVL